MEIKSFSGEYSFLSNFYPVKINYMGVWFPTVEHAYVAAKNPTRDFILAISKQPATKAGVVKRMGKGTKLRSDWERVKYNIMKELVKQKFNEGELQKALVGTQNEQLIEGNWWHDNFWGACSCKKCEDKPKHNHLGKLLMKIRSDLTNIIVSELMRISNEKD